MKARTFVPTSPVMYLKFVIIVGALLATVFAAPSKAQDMSPSDLFHAAAQANSSYALGASYAFGQDPPVTMTAGPTTKRGSVAVADTARWHIGSISKSFTSTLVMRLVERGELDLDAPVEQYLAAYNDSMHSDWKAISLRQLLSHTAGLPASASRRITNETYEHEPYEGRRAVLSAMWSSPLNGETGNFLYSNIGYVLAGLIVEEVLGVAWEEAILSEVSVPLGLFSLGFGAPRQSDAANGHQSILGFRRTVSPENPASDNPRWMGPAGTIHLSMADLVRWGQMHLAACGGHIQDYLTQASCLTMQTPIASDYGLGWVIQNPDTSGPSVWHNGSNMMWYAMLLIAPEHELVVAVATNVYTHEPIDRLTLELTTALVNSRE